MLTIHHLDHSRSERIVWLAEELALPYQLVCHDRDALTHRAPPSLHAVNPLGKAPFIEDDGVKLGESGAIVEYLLEKYGAGRLRPASNDPAWPSYLYWMHGAESTLMVAPLTDLLTTATGATSDAMTAFLLGDYATVLGHLNAVLSRQDYVAGKAFTAADIMVAYTLSMIGVELFPGSGLIPKTSLAGYPAVSAYLQRMHAREAWQRTRQRIGE